ncbi:MAG: hypothetical protein QOG01_2545 [Pseudonocardiales bacterium]|jgi:hypothetical protein|nr:hypothetical protein [Pseudonocardiales bacterium]
MVSIRENIALDDAATSTQTGTVGEPSAAASRTGMFITGNWYASRSLDAGQTWTFVDPFSQFSQNRGAFCCDQLILWAPAQKIWIWLLQYAKSGDTNIFRVAVSTDALTWRSWEVTPGDVNSQWSTSWFDYPDMALSDQHLWISFNQYGISDQWLRASVFRYPLDQLAALANGETVSLLRAQWVTRDHGSLRFVVGAGDTMWWASNDVAASVLHVFAWQDDGASIESWAVRVDPWNDSDYASSSPANLPWLARCDDRVTGGWRVPSSSAGPARLGWLWTSGRTAARPHAFIRAATLREDDLSIAAQPDLWSANGAWAYPAAAPNGRGRVGLTAFYGSASDFPSHCVGVLGSDGASWTTKRAATSTHAPRDGKWGDYITIQPHPRRPTGWVASGFTLQGGQDRRNVEPRVVCFRD